MPKKLLSPDDVRDFLVRRFNNQQQNWLIGEGGWPLDVGLGVPTEKDVADDPGGVRNWVSGWASRTGPGQVTWVERQFARLGTQRFPVKLCFESASEVAAVVGQTKRWNLAVERYQRIVGRWAAFGQSTTAIAAKFNVLADYSSDDFERLFSLLEWFEFNPSSDLYLRQLPIEGLDTKWIEQRIAVVCNFLRILRDQPESKGFYELCGLRRQPHRVRIRLLCSELRAIVGGLGDIEAPIAELAALSISPRVVVIVENQETGLAMPDIPEAVVIMKLGNAVSALDALPWIRGSTMVYWGDIDTHGFAILHRARRILPDLRSVLMDEATLLGHLSLCGEEAVQCSNAELELLQAHERAVFNGLKANTWGQQLRLEQERLPWTWALNAILNEVNATSRTG